MNILLDVLPSAVIENYSFSPQPLYWGEKLGGNSERKFLLSAWTAEQRHEPLRSSSRNGAFSGGFYFFVFFVSFSSRDEGNKLYRLRDVKVATFLRECPSALDGIREEGKEGQHQRFQGLAQVETGD